MKLNLIFLFFALPLFSTYGSAQEQDKAKRPSPPATVTEKINNGATITINYSSPSLKGRTIGKDVEPKEGAIWRAGANEATTFEADKDVKIDGKKLAAGKYALFTKTTGNDWTVILNKEWKTWGAYDYDKNKDKDALQFKAKSSRNNPVAEKLAYTISKDGKVTLAWGEYRVWFNVN